MMTIKSGLIEWCRMYDCQFIHDDPTTHPLYHSLNPPIELTKDGEMRYLEQDEYEAFLEEKYKQLERYKGDDILFLIQRPYRLSALEYLIEEEFISQEKFIELFPRLWDDTEFPSRSRELMESLWNHWIEAKGFDEHKATKEKRDELMKQGTHVKVYRGFCTDPDYVNGYSWTLNREKAVWFSQRFTAGGKKAFVATMTVPVEEILFYSDERNEDEVVINLSVIKDTHIVEV